MAGCCESRRVGATFVGCKTIGRCLDPSASQSLTGTDHDHPSMKTDKQRLEAIATTIRGSKWFIQSVGKRSSSYIFQTHYFEALEIGCGWTNVEAPIKDVIQLDWETHNLTHVILQLQIPRIPCSILAPPPPKNGLLKNKVTLGT